MTNQDLNLPKLRDHLASHIEGFSGELTAEKFVQNPFSSGTKMYRTQDLVRINENGIIEF